MAPLLQRIWGELDTEHSFSIWYGWAPPARRTDMAFSVEANVYLATYAIYPDEADDERYRSWVHGRTAELAAAHGCGAYLGDTDFSRRQDRFLSDDAYARLVEIRAQRDPQGRFAGYLDGGRGRAEPPWLTDPQPASGPTTSASSCSICPGSPRGTATRSASSASSPPGWPAIDLDIEMLRHPAYGYRVELLHRSGTRSGTKPPDPGYRRARQRASATSRSTSTTSTRSSAQPSTAGARPVMAPQQSPEPGVRMAFVADPEGNLIELLQRPALVIARVATARATRSNAATSGRGESANRTSAISAGGNVRSPG